MGVDDRRRRRIVGRVYVDAVGIAGGHGSEIAAIGTQRHILAPEREVAPVQGQGAQSVQLLAGAEAPLHGVAADQVLRRQVVEQLRETRDAIS